MASALRRAGARRWSPVALSALAMAALLLGVGAARPWAVDLTGSQAAPILPTAALVSGAAAAALLATGPRGRRALGSALLLVAALVAWQVTHVTTAAGDPATGDPGWPLGRVAAMVGAVVLAASGVMVMAGLGGTARMGRRFDRAAGASGDIPLGGGRGAPAAGAPGPGGPDAPGAPSARDQWRAMDEGRDPTA